MFACAVFLLLASEIAAELRVCKAEQNPDSEEEEKKSPIALLAEQIQCKVQESFASKQNVNTLVNMYVAILQ